MIRQYLSKPRAQGLVAGAQSPLGYVFLDVSHVFRLMFISEVYGSDRPSIVGGAAKDSQMGAILASWDEPEEELVDDL